MSPITFVQESALNCRLGAQLAHAATGENLVLVVTSSKFSGRRSEISERQMALRKLKFSTTAFCFVAGLYFGEIGLVMGASAIPENELQMSRMTQMLLGGVALLVVSLNLKDFFQASDKKFTVAISGGS